MYGPNERRGLAPELDYSEPPAGSDRRAFMMRSAWPCHRGADRLQAGRCHKKAPGQGSPAPQRPVTLGSRTLNVVKKSKGPVMTTIEEFYKVGPGPSSSHTIGPMRITYDFYQRCTKLPAGSAREGDRRSRCTCSAA